MDMQVFGAKEVALLLEKLEKKETPKIVRKGTRDAMKSAVLPDAKTNAQSMVGGSMGAKIARSLAVRAMTKMKRGHYGSKVIIKASDLFVHISNAGKRYFIPFAIEYGHAYPGRGGKNAPKDVKPMPFMRKAYEANRKKAAGHLLKRMRILVDEAVRRNRKSA